MRSWSISSSELGRPAFRLKFQLKMGQTESLKKIRELRKDIARIKTVTREKELGIAAPCSQQTELAPELRPAKPKKAAATRAPRRRDEDGR